VAALSLTYAMAIARPREVFAEACRTFNDTHTAALETYNAATLQARNTVAEACRKHREAVAGPQAVHGQAVQRAVDRLPVRDDVDEDSDAWCTYLATIAKLRHAYETATAAEAAEMERAWEAYTAAIAGPLEAYNQAVAEARAPFTVARRIYEAAIAGPRRTYEAALADAGRA